MDVLFVCTGNVFRSMTAEKCMNHYIKKNGIKNIRADSAGTKTSPQSPQPATIERLGFYGINFEHRYKKLTQELLDRSDVVIAMNIDHRDFIIKNFKVKPYLFNELAYGKKEGVLDFHEFHTNIKELANQEEIIKEYAYYVVDYIHSSIPRLVERLESIEFPKI